MRRQGPGTCPSGDPVNLQLPLLLSAFPSFKPDVHFPLFLSFFHPLALFRSPSLLLSGLSTKALRQQDSRALASVFLRLWENSSSCFLRCFSHSSPVSRSHGPNEWAAPGAQTQRNGLMKYGVLLAEREQIPNVFCAHVCFLCSTGLSKWYLGHQIIAYPCKWHFYTKFHNTLS